MICFVVYCAILCLSCKTGNNNQNSSQPEKLNSEELAAICFGCSTIEEARLFEKEINSEELQLTCAQELYLFFHDALMHSHDTTECHVRKYTGRTKTRMDRLNIKYQYFARKRTDSKFIEIVKYEYYYEEDKHLTNDCNLSEGQLIAAQIIMFDEHPYSPIAQTDSTLAIDNIYLSDLEYLRLTEVNHYKGLYADDAFTESTRKLEWENKVADKDRVNELLNISYRWCCKDTTSILMFFQTKTPIETSYLVQPVEDLNSLTVSKPHYVIEAGDLMQTIFVFYHGNFKNAESTCILDYNCNYSSHNGAKCLKQ